MRVINIASDGKVVDDLSSDVRFPLVVLRRPAEDKIEVFVAEDPIAMARSVEAGERATKRRLLVACPFALVALALARADVPGRDESWLDLCAGPGGKAGLLGSIAALHGAEVTAVEVAEHRARLVLPLRHRLYAAAINFRKIASVVYHERNENGKLS